MSHPRSLLREGIIAGALGATGVAVWFLIVDTIQGRPLYTPTVLGSAVSSFFGPTTGESALALVVGYTIFHYAIFALVGILCAVIVRWSETEPHVLAGFLILFVAFELGFYGLAALLARSNLLGTLAWYQIALGNLIAAALMGTYLWRTHPSLAGGFAHALGGRE